MITDVAAEQVQSLSRRESAAKWALRAASLPYMWRVCLKEQYEAGNRCTIIDGDSAPVYKAVVFEGFFVAQGSTRHLCRVLAFLWYGRSWSGHAVRLIFLTVLCFACSSDC
jgi:hypothetical protein